MLVCCILLVLFPVLVALPHNSHAQVVSTLVKDSTGQFYYDITTDNAGNLYVADFYNHRVRKVVIATGEVIALAGNNTPGFKDGIGAAVQFHTPRCITHDGEGNLYVADFYNHRVRKIVIATGEVTTLAGNSGARHVDGIGTSAWFEYPFGIAHDGVGNLYVTDNGIIRKVVIATGEVTTLAGSKPYGFVDGIGGAARFQVLTSITSDGAGNLYVTDAGSIRKIVIATREVTTLAGDTALGFMDGIGRAARFSNMYGITYDGAGNLYVADVSNHRIRKIAVTTGIVTTIAGTGVYGQTDGPVAVAQFSYPGSITIDAQGNLYITNVNSIRKITLVSEPQLQAPQSMQFADTLCRFSPSFRESLLLMNSGTAPLRIDSVVVVGRDAAEFVVVSRPTSPIAPNTSGTVVVLYTPLRVGTKEATLRVYSNATNASTASIQLSARRDTTGLRVSATTLTFSSSDGSPVPRTLTVTNTGTVPRPWNGGRQDSTSKFRVVSVNPPTTPPGGTSEFTIRFLGGVAGQAYTDTLGLPDLCGRETLVTLRAAVSQPAALETAPQADLGVLRCERTSTATLTLRNVGDSKLLITDVRYEGLDGTEFALLDNVDPSTGKFSAAISNNDSLKVTLRFAPTSNGFKQGRLMFFTNADATREVSVSIRAEKRSTGWQFVPDTVRFESLEADKPYWIPVRLRNTGTEPVVVDTAAFARQTGGRFVLTELEKNPIPLRSMSDDVQAYIRFLGGKCGEPLAYTVRLPLPCGDSARLSVAASIPSVALIDTNKQADVVNMLCELQRSVYVPVENKGCRILRVDSVQVRGADSALFRLVAGQFPMRIEGGGLRQIELLLTTTVPRDTGEKRVTITIFSDADRLGQTNFAQKNFEIRARKEWLAFSADADSVGIQTTQANTAVQRTLTLTNRGTRAIVWQAASSLPVRVGEYFVVDSIVPAITPVRGSSQVFVRFVGGAEGLTTSVRWRLASVECSTEVGKEFTFSAAVDKKARIRVMQGVVLKPLVCESSQDTMIVIENFGSDALVVNAQLEGNASGAFRLLRVPSAPIPPNERDMVFVRYTPPQPSSSIPPASQATQTTFHSADVVLTSNAVNAPRAVVKLQAGKDSVGLRLSAVSLALPSVPENTPSEAWFTVENTGTLASRWTLPIAFGAVMGGRQEFVLDSITQNPIAAGSTARVRVRFVGGAGGARLEMLRLRDTCGREYALAVSVLVISGRAALPAILEAVPGQEFDVPVWLRGRVGVPAAATVALTLSLGNASLAEFSSSVTPLPTKQSIVQGARMLELQTPIPSANEDEPLVRLKIRVLLGNDTATTLRVERATIGGASVTAGSTNAVELKRDGAELRLRLVGLNQAGGTRRLFYAAKAVTIVSVSPNPVIDGALHLVLKAIEAAPITVRLVDVYGQARELFAGRIESGLQTIALPTHALPTGVYVLELLSPVGTQTHRITIVK